MYLRGIVKNAIPLRIAKEYLSLFQFTEKEKEEDFKTPKKPKKNHPNREGATNGLFCE